MGGVLAVVGELAIKNRLHQRSQHEAVVVGHQVDGRAHHRDPDELTLLDEVGERHGIEAGEPRPESGVRVVRDLRLHADEVADGGLRFQRRPIEQQLALQRGPIELAAGEDVGAHSGSGTDSYVRSSTRLSSGSRM